MKTYYQSRRCIAKRVTIVVDGERRNAVEVQRQGRPAMFLLDVQGRTWSAITQHKGDISRVDPKHRLVLIPDPLTTPKDRS